MMLRSVDELLSNNGDDAWKETNYCKPHGVAIRTEKSKMAGQIEE